VDLVLDPLKNLDREKFNGAEEKKVKPVMDCEFEKRKHPRFSVDLPVEYSRTDLAVEKGRVMNASQGGLLLYLPEQMEMGHHLTLKLFFTVGSELNTIETVVEVVWVDIHLERNGRLSNGSEVRSNFRGGCDRLQDFLKSLSV